MARKLLRGVRRQKRREKLWAARRPHSVRRTARMAGKLLRGVRRQKRREKLWASRDSVHWVERLPKAKRCSKRCDRSTRSKYTAPHTNVCSIHSEDLRFFVLEAWNRVSHNETKMVVGIKIFHEPFSFTVLAT